LTGVVLPRMVSLTGPERLFGVYGQSVHTVLALPVFAWEVSFAIWLIVKGFKPSTITASSSSSVQGHTPLPLGS
jgi:hypothetical protein